MKEYAYTAGELPAFPERTETGSYASVWKDQLVNWNGTAMTYDAIGNMLTRGNITYRWIMGRKLAGVNNGKNIQYFYDHTGSRTKKVVDGTATEYRMAGELLVSEITNGQTFWYTYDSNANLVSIIIGGKNYFYVRNLQNDIIALIDEDGNTVVNYTYDSWGKILSITGSLKDTVGQQNPFRYRGYYYDKETGMYYLKNRYYDPELRRFICFDKFFSTGNGSIEKNMFSYCLNNPTTYYDPAGDLPCGCVYNGTAGDFARLEHGLPPGNCKHSVNKPSNGGMPKYIDITRKLDRTMENNAMELRKYRKKNGFLASISYFIQSVKTGGKWDLKNQYNWKFNNNSTYIYNGDSVRQDDIGNIHYGYVGRELFGAITLVLGGGLYQIKTDFPDIQWNHFYAAFDDPQDQLMVLYGTVLWDRDNRDWF